MTHPSSHGVPRPPGLRRGVPGLAVVILAAAGAGSFVVAPAHAAAPRIAASQPLVQLRADHVARTWPDARAHRIELVAARRPLTGVRTVLPVLRYARSHGGSSWVRVRLPGRPTGHTGWIRADRTRRAATEWHILLTLSTRRVTVYRDGYVERRFRAVVGKPSTPTPRGRFFIEEALALPAQHSGPFALATSARSNVLQEFDGGPGQIALHGTRGLSGALGTAASHGCVRLSTSAITWLAARIGSGVPLTVTR
jgi:lipoprotein-anchoring transpeptidase ErfK/SrfK